MSELVTWLRDTADADDFYRKMECAKTIERLECSLAISRKKHELAIEVNKSLQARVEALEGALHEIAEYERDFPLFAVIAKTAIAGG